MNRIRPLREHTVLIMPGLVMAMLLVAFTSMATGRALIRPSQPGAGDTIVVQTQQTSKKQKIKLYPDASREVLFFSVQGEDGKIYQLFLFNIDGGLVKQVNIKNKQTTILNHIDKGNYLFEVFSNDERIENGQIIVR